jgi:hypothetical protein
MSQEQNYTVFTGDRLLGAGQLNEILYQAKEYIDAQQRAGTDPAMLIFEDESGRQIDFDFQGSAEQVVARAMPPSRLGPGRPRLGVVAREVSLLPRHWEWLERQPNGASAALRRLVDEARKHEPPEARARIAMDTTYRVMTALGGDRPGYEEAIRALYAKDRARFTALTKEWPADVLRYLERLSGDAFL